MAMERCRLESDYTRVIVVASGHEPPPAIRGDARGASPAPARSATRADSRRRRRFHRRRAGAGARTGAKPRQPDRTRATIVLEPEQERLVDAYASTATQGRLALKVRCDAPPAASGAVSESDLQFVDFTLSVARADGEKDPQPMKSDQLHAIVGREASV